MRGILLDVDGTLLDSNEAHAAAYAQALLEEGLEIPVAKIRPLIGMGGEKLLPALGVQLSSPTGERVSRRKKEVFDEEFLPHLRPTHGARDLLDHMKSLGLELGVATSADAGELRALLRQAGLEDRIDARSSSSDAKSSKPDPDIVEAAIARSRYDRSELVMIGDTPYDVEAAARAGVPIVAVRCGGWSDRDLAGAVAIYDDPAHLLAEYDQSIFGGSGSSK